MLTKKALRKTTVQTTAEMMSDMAKLLGVNTYQEIQDHPERKIAAEIVCDYRGKKPGTLKIIFQHVNGFMNKGLFHKSIGRQTAAYVLGVYNAGLITDMECVNAMKVHATYEPS
ncbi:MAG TPA: hypothetical protein EYQ01_10150 [Nitrospira sp.]|nr:hypothetical protein [Candidatus Manganitrophaceae bacterium]